MAGECRGGVVAAQGVKNFVDENVEGVGVLKMWGARKVAGVVDEGSGPGD